MEARAERRGGGRQSTFLVQRRLVVELVVVVSGFVQGAGEEQRRGTGSLGSRGSHRWRESSRLRLWHVCYPGGGRWRQYRKSRRRGYRNKGSYGQRKKSSRRRLCHLGSLSLPCLAIGIVHRCAIRHDPECLGQKFTTIAIGSPVFLRRNLLAASSLYRHFTNLNRY